MPDESNGPYSNNLFANKAPACPQLAWWERSRQPEEVRAIRAWIYSSAGFVTLGFAVAAAAAKGGLTGGYPALLEEVIAAALGMPNTFGADNVPPHAGALFAKRLFEYGPLDSSRCLSPQTPRRLPRSNRCLKVSRSLYDRYCSTVV